MVGVDIILLFAGTVGLATANPVRLDLRQSGALTTSPPWYPSRTFFPFFPSELLVTWESLTRRVVAKGGSSASWADSYAKAHDLVSKMSLIEKGGIGSAGAGSNYGS